MKSKVHAIINFSPFFIRGLLPEIIMVLGFGTLSQLHPKEEFAHIILEENPDIEIVSQEEQSLMHVIDYK